MTLILLNLQSNQLIKLDNENPLIIGRGNVEGCFDKRVSRSHGKITCTLDGKIRLEALHCNPCFFTRKGVPPILQVNKNEEETLNEGDFLGLLPNAFWFKITTDKDIKIKQEPEHIKTEVNCDENDLSNNLGENHNTAEEDKVQDPACSAKEQLNSSSCSTKGFGSPEFEKTRRLPLWMYEIDDPSETKHGSNKRPGASDKLASKKKQRTSTETKNKEEEIERTDNGDKADHDLNAFNIPSTSRAVNIEESTPISCCGTESTAEAENKSKEVSIKKEGYESDVNDEGASTSRPICQYEGNCYRKNAQHKLELSHPGDSDYIAYEKRPLCPFGARCYRKNEKHKVEFRHPQPSTSQASSPLPAKRRRKKVKKENSTIEDSDEYDLEDPFINDASSDEYVPTDLDSEEEEEEDLDASREDD